MLITVIVCTRNRARQLRNLLESFLTLDQPAQAAWEMIVVDNGSTDDTAKVIDELALQLPLRRVWEPKAGLSNARNTGVSHSKGDYICWTDDDVEVHHDWLASYARAFHRYPDGTIFGGRVEPVFEAPPPSWITDNVSKLENMLAKRDHGPDERRILNDQALLPYGANFAVRAKEQRQFLYDPNLGVSPNQRRVGEETIVLNAIADLGGAHYWIPSSRVRHLIPSDRMTFDYVAVYSQSVGETWAYLSATNGRPIMGPPLLLDGRKIFGAPIWIWRKSFSTGLCYRLKKMIGLDPSLWLDDLIFENRLIGARNYLTRLQFKSLLQSQ